MASVSTFRSTVSLLKGKLANKDRKASKEAKAAVDRSTVSYDRAVVKKSSRSLPKDSKSRKSIPPPEWNGKHGPPDAYRIRKLTIFVNSSSQDSRGVHGACFDEVIERATREERCDIVVSGRRVWSG